MNTSQEFKLEKLSAKNYSTWKTVMSSLLKGKGLWPYVEAITDLKNNSIMQKNEEAKHLMYAAMEPSQITATGSCDSAKELWEKIQENHEGAESDFRISALSDFLGFKYQKNETPVQYSGRYENALGRLEASGKPVDEATKIWVFRNSLPKEMKTFVNTWMIAKPDGVIAELITDLKIHYHLEKDDVSEQNVAFYNNEKSTTFKQTSSKTNKDKPEQTCTYCKKKGHMWKNCYKLKGDNKRKKKYGEANKKKPEETKKHEAFLACTSSYDDYDNQDTWIIDSGASRHMTGRRELLHDYQELKEPHKVMIGNGDFIIARGFGAVVFEENTLYGKLADVLWVPDLKKNLFSVRQTINKGCDVRFERDQVKISRQGIVKMIGNRMEGIFVLKLDAKPVSMTEFCCSCEDITTWHERFAHVGHDAIKEIVRKDAVKGLTLSKDPKSPCIYCKLGKLCRSPHPNKQPRHIPPFCCVLHIDTCGPMETKSIGGAKYFVLFVEETSGYRYIRFVYLKSEIKQIVTETISDVETDSGKKVIAIYTDNGTEFVNNFLQIYLKAKAIKHVTSAPYTPEQNGLVERSNRTVIEAARTMLIHSKLPKFLWAEAANTAVFVLNRTLSPRDPSKTRFELHTGQKPDVSKLKTFGQYAVVKSNYHEDKWAPKGNICRFVGYTIRSNTYRFYDESKQRIIISCDANFLPSGYTPNVDLKDGYVTLKVNTSAEDNPSSNESTNEILHSLDNWLTSTPVQGYTEISDLHDISAVDEPQMHFQSSTPSNPENLAARRELNNLIIKDPNYQIHKEIRSRFPDAEQNRPLTRARLAEMQPIFPDPIQPTSNLQVRNIEQTSSNREHLTNSFEANSEDYHSPDSEPIYEQINFTLEDEPRTLEDAKQTAEWSDWKAAMDEEMDALRKNNTWIEVPRPNGTKLIKNRWVFKRKLNPDRFKARLVAKGYSQIPNLDYKETFAPVASMATIRLVLNIANCQGMTLLQFDVKTAFLHGDLEEEIYMEFPAGYNNPDNSVCRLVKSLYGLKQAPRQWNKKFDDFLKRFNLKQCNIDKCLYYDEARTIILVIYVDDGIVAAKSENLATELVTYLQKFLELKTMECKSYLGFEIDRDTEARTLKIHQTAYINRILDRFNMKDCKIASTPEEVGVCNTSQEKLSDGYPFKELVGSLLYLVTCTRPDIAHAVSMASRTSDPTQEHWARLKRILRYLKGTLSIGILFRWENDPELVGYSDADYASDSETRRSTSGHCIMYANAPIAWRCQKQTIVALSTTEAEYISGCDLVKDLLPIREILVELGQMKDQPAKVCIDNLSAVRIAKNDGSQQRTKHIDVRKKWLNEQQESKKIDVKFVTSNNQLADMLTKPLQKRKFINDRNKLMSPLILLALMCLTTGVAGYEFRMSRPVVFENKNDHYYIDGTKQFELEIRIINPCTDYFLNITVDEKHNNQLISDCKVLFTKQTLKSFDNCVSYNKTLNKFDKKIRVHRAAILPAAAWAFTAGTQVWVMYRQNQVSNDVETIAEHHNQSNQILVQAHKALNTTRHTIKNVNKQLEDLQTKIDFLSEKDEALPKVIALVAEYELSFQRIRDALTSIDIAFGSKKTTPDLFKLLNGYTLWVEPASRWSTASLCTFDYIGDDLKLKYVISVPQINKSIKIMKAESFKFWNQTSPTEYCWMKYAGPNYILANSTNNCLLHLETHWVKDQSVRGHTCMKANEALGIQAETFHPEECYDTLTPSNKEIQVFEHHGLQKIYCFGHNITIQKQNLTCPRYVFEIPNSVSYSLEGYEYEASNITDVVINYVESQIDKDLAKQLKLDKVKISGVNFTEMDDQIDILSRLVDKFTPNITLAHTSLPDILKSPITFIMNTFNSITDFVQKGLMALAFGAFVFLIVMAAPLIELIFLFIRIATKIACTWWNITRRALRRVARKTEERIQERRLDRRNRYKRMV